MKKITLGLMLLLMLPLALGATVSRNMPTNVVPNGQLGVTFNINTEIGKTFALEDQVPSGFSLIGWDITGADKAAVETRFANGKYAWSFKPTSTSVVLSYTLQAPASGTYSFDAIYFDAAGQGKSQGSVTVGVITTTVPVTTTIRPTTVPTTVLEEETTVIADEPQEQGAPLWPLIIVMVLVLIGLVVYYIWRRKHHHRLY